MINLHPTTEQLQEFAAGSSSPAMSLMIASHVDMCKHCQLQVEQIQFELSEAVFADQAMLERDKSPSFDNMLANIVQLPVAEEGNVINRAPKIELDGRSFNVPRPLHRFVEKTGNWSHLLGNLWQAPVDLGGAGKANFIFMGKGGKVPEHTHRGSELTLVIDGEFGDGLAQYDTGDFIQMDGTRKHAPHSDAEEGCLVFSIVDKPLHFTSGVARLLNPFSHLFF